MPRPDAWVECTTDSSSCSCTNDVWGHWTVDWCATNGTTTTAVWRAWTEGTVTWTSGRDAVADVPEDAKQKAREILDRHLTEEQRAQLARDQFFVVQGSKGRRYRIGRGRVQNVIEIDDNDRMVARLCAHPSIACPDEDTMLVQKLTLETDEDEFLRVANRMTA